MMSIFGSAGSLDLLGSPVGSSSLESFPLEPPSNKVLLCSTGLNGVLSVRSLARVDQKDQDALNAKVATVWEQAEKLTEGKGIVKTVNLTKLVVSYRDANGKISYIDLKGNDSEGIDQGIKDVRDLITGIWKESFAVRNVKGYNLQGLGNGCLSGVGSRDHSADLGGFIASGQMRALMDAALDEGDLNSVLDRVILADAALSGLQNGVERQIKEKKEAIGKKEGEIRKKVSPNEKKLYVAKSSRNSAEGEKAREGIRKASKSFLEEKSGLEKELEELMDLKDTLSKIDRDAIYWAAGMGSKGLAGDAAIKAASKLSLAVERFVEFNQDGVSPKDRKEYAEQVGDLLLSRREDYLARVMGENGKVFRTAKTGSLEFFVVQMATCGCNAEAEEISKWVPEKMRSVVEKCRGDVLVSWIKRDEKIKKTEVSTWEDRLENMQKIEGAIPRSGLGYRVGRGIGRCVATATLGVKSALKKSAAFLYEVLPTRLPFYARGAHLRTSTANEVKEKYFQEGDLKQSEILKPTLEAWDASELQSTLGRLEIESEQKALKLKGFKDELGGVSFKLKKLHENLNNVLDRKNNLAMATLTARAVQYFDRLSLKETELELKINEVEKEMVHLKEWVSVQTIVSEIARERVEKAKKFFEERE